MHAQLWGWSQWLKYIKIKINRYRMVQGRHCRRLRHNSHSFPAHLLNTTTVLVVFSDYSCHKIMSLHCWCIALYLSWVPFPILYSCSSENRMTAQRASPLLKPNAGSTEKGDLPSLVLRSVTLHKLFSPLSALHSSLTHFFFFYSFFHNFPGSTRLQQAANTLHSSSPVKLHLSSS